MEQSASSGKKLSLYDLTSMAVGQIIGAGIMTMLGIGIGLTGRSVVFALIVAAILTIFCSIPQIILAGTATFPGGYYTMFATLCNKKLAGIYTYINLFMVLGISFYALSFASYFLSLFPNANEKLLCTVVMTLLLLLHLFGVKQAARLQNVMTVILAVALALYIVLGMGNLEPNFFDPAQFMTSGPMGFVLASVFLTFAFGGGTFIVSYSGQAKNPMRDIPVAMIVSTLFVAVFYLFIAIVAVSTLPVAEAANQPLSVSAAVFMPDALYTFFVVGGGMFALLTSMNFCIGNLVYPAVTACMDGWLPKALMVKNKRFGTNHLILLAIYVVVLVPVLLGMDMQTAANSTVILSFAIFIIACYAALRMPKKIPGLWATSKFHCNETALKVLCVVAMVVLVLGTLLLIFTSAPAEIVGNILVLAVSAVLGVLVSKRATVPVLDGAAPAEKE